MWLKLLMILLLLEYLDANCDVCQSGKAACHSENTYSICVKGRATGEIITCPLGHTCTAEKFICYPEAEGYKPICKTGDTAPENPPAEDTDFRLFCASRDNGSYTNEKDPTSKTFISCFNGWGEVEVCHKINKKPTYFNGKKCVVDE